MKPIIHFISRGWRKASTALFMLGVVLSMIPADANAQVTTVNINSPGSNPYVIAAGSGDYHFTGSGTATVNRINVANGYHGTITLENVNIECPVNYAPIRIYGTFNGDNNTPTTMVNLILKGTNRLFSGNGAATSDAAGLQVDQGAQIDISAFDPTDNTSGTLTARTYHCSDGAAGIGGSCVQRSIGDGASTGTYTGNYMYRGVTPKSGTGRRTTGGNIVITSGTIWARGGRCGAGIGGGGYAGLYTGNVIITGGDVTSIGGDHSPGIGGGCDNGDGNKGAYVPGTAVIAVPPAKITAYTTTNCNSDTKGTEKGLSGANTIVYIGDPQSPQFTVYTEDYKATTMYLDLSGDPAVKAKLEQFAPTLDPARMYLGDSKVYPSDLPLFITSLAGKNIVQNYGTFTGPITFFTDAKNDKGFEYLPETRTMTPNIGIELYAPIYDPTMTMEKYVPVIGALPPLDTADLVVGYLTSEAIDKAVTLVFKNNGNTKLYNPVIEIYAPNHTAIDGGSLITAIVDSMAAHYTTDAGGDFLAPGEEFRVLARLNDALPKGDYQGTVRFDADNVPTAYVKLIPFVTKVVRIELPPPVLTTVPGGIDETNIPFTVEAEFVRPVTGVVPADIQILGGTVSGLTPVTPPPTEFWQFDVTPAVGLTSGQVIQLYAKENIAYDDHSARTNDKSNALNVAYNVDKPFATFHFPYDVPVDSVFITAQPGFTFSINANGGSGTTTDSLYVSSVLATIADISSLITIEKDGGPYAAWSVTSYVWDAVDGVHKVTVTGSPAFGEGAYKITLAGGVIENNVPNLMDEKKNGFYVRIPEITIGPSGPNIGYGIEPVPTSLDYHGGNVLLKVTGRNLQYAEALGLLEIELPAALLNTHVIPHAAANGLTASWYPAVLPNNNTTTSVTHAFKLLLNGVMPDPDAIGYTDVGPAPTISVDSVADKWFGHCEQVLRAVIPYTGAPRDVYLEYIGLAKDYLIMLGGVRPPVKVTVGSGIADTVVYLRLKTLPVPDDRNGGTGAIAVSSPGLPSDTTNTFVFYNSPNVDDMVYIPRSPMYPGLLEFNIRGGSPTLERSFDDVRWESAWLPVTPLQISNLEGIVYFREPDGCDGDLHFPIRGFFDDDYNGSPAIEREINLPVIPNFSTDPPAGRSYISSGGDFVFTVTLSEPYAGMMPGVTTDRKLLSDEEGITVRSLGDGVFEITIHAVRESFTILDIRAIEDRQSVGSVDSPRIWTSSGQIHIHSVLSGEARIFTLTGALIKSIPLLAGETYSTPLASGFYVVVTLNDGKTYKVVVQ
jgi:hypothetical protein